MSTRSLGAALLRSWRLRRKDTQSKAAEFLGIDMVQMSKYESGRVRPSREKANRIAKLTKGAVPSSSWDESDDEASAAKTTGGGDDKTAAAG